MATFAESQAWDNAAGFDGGIMYISEGTNMSVRGYVGSHTLTHALTFPLTYLHTPSHTFTYAAVRRAQIWRSTFQSSTALRGGAFFGTDTSQYFITQSVIRFNNGTMVSTACAVCPRHSHACCHR